MDKPDADYRYFICTNCGVKLRTKFSNVDKQLPCPKCGTVLAIPASQAGLHQQHEITDDAAGETTVETYDIREEPEEPQPVLTVNNHSGPSGAEEDAEDFEDSEKKHRGLIQEPSVRPKPPRRPLVQGVLQFLLELGAIVYWSALSIMGTMSIAILLMSMIMYQTPSMASRAASVIFLAIGGILSMVFLISNSIACLTILQDSAAGNQVIEEWPGINYVDYIQETFYIINSMLVSGIVVWLLTYPLAGIEALRLLVGIIFFALLFPIILLSMLEVGSCLIPFSLLVFQSLRRSWKSWLVFYIESFSIIFGMLAYLGLLSFLLDYYSLHVTLPILLISVAMFVGPAVLLEMIYFRLMGRLVWVCDDDLRKEEAEEDDEGDQDDAEANNIHPTPIDDF